MSERPAVVDEIVGACNDAILRLNDIDLDEQGREVRDYVALSRRVLLEVQDVAHARRFRGMPASTWNTLRDTVFSFGHQLATYQSSPSGIPTNTGPQLAGVLQQLSVFSALNRVPTSTELADRVAAAERAAELSIESVRAEIVPVVQGLAQANEWLATREERWQTWRRVSLRRLWEARRASERHEASIAERDAIVVQRTSNLLDLIVLATNAQSIDFFNTESEEHRESETRYWKWSLVVLGFALVFGLGPALLSNVYWLFSDGHEALFDNRDGLLAHLAAAAALAAVATVLLRRVGRHQQTGQRARDLSIALSTMFAYAEQLPEGENRTAFLRDMGRTIIESYLRSPSSPPSDASDGLLALLAKRPAT